MTIPKSQTALEKRLIEHIAKYGPVTFESFMNVVLYDNDQGYYPTRRRASGSKPVGTDGDYFTSPITHPAFGGLLALQLREMWQILDSPSEFTVVEMGAGDGTLRSDILEYVQRQLPDFAQAIRYIATDLVPPTNVNNVNDNSCLPVNVVGCIISNELLDAYPFNRFIVQNGVVKEIFVDYQNGEFVDSVSNVSEPEIAARVDPFLRSLPEGYRGEVNLRLGYWSDSVSAALRRGYVITVDYGYDRPDLYESSRGEGSMRCYYQHTLSQDPLRRIGKQDITSHVDFTAVDHTLMVNRINRVGRLCQRQFLLNLGIEDFLHDITVRALTKELSRSQSQENFTGIEALIDLQGLGKFRVVVHSKNVDDVHRITGVTGCKSLVEGRNAPILNNSEATHARLLRSSNPFGQDNAELRNGMTWEQLFCDDSSNIAN